MNQMRELFEKWAKSECLDTDSVDGFYSDNDTHIAWGSWQAAQSAAVPVVGDVPTAEQVGEEIGMHTSAWDCVDPEKIIAAVLKLSKPTASITAAELDALRKDAEKWRVMMRIEGEGK